MAPRASEVPSTSIGIRVSWIGPGSIEANMSNAPQVSTISSSMRGVPVMARPSVSPSAEISAPNRTWVQALMPPVKPIEHDGPYTNPRDVPGPSSF